MPEKGMVALCLAERFVVAGGWGLIGPARARAAHEAVQQVTQRGGVGLRHAGQLVALGGLGGGDDAQR